jgi:HSP20 family protein
VHDGVLTIQGDKHPHPDAAGFDYEKQERRFGGFIRTFALPLNIQLDNIKAKYESGLLTIRFPKVAEPAEDPGIPIE